MKAPLDDRRIDRYSRQLLLREIGSRGQQALFESRVRVRGTARAAELVATWLSGAGVGVIELADIPAPVALRERNEDVTWTDAEPASLVVGVGPLPQSKWTTTSAVVWAAATGAQVVCVRAPHPPSLPPVLRHPSPPRGPSADGGRLPARIGCRHRCAWNPRRPRFCRPCRGHRALSPIAGGFEPSISAATFTTDTFRPRGASLRPTNLSGNGGTDLGWGRSGSGR